MIQRITKNTDINFLIDDSRVTERFIIKFFTTDRTKAIVRTSEDVVTEADGVAIGYGATVNSGGLLIKANNKDMIRADLMGKIYLQNGKGTGTFCLQDVLTKLGATL